MQTEQQSVGVFVLQGNRGVLVNCSPRLLQDEKGTCLCFLLQCCMFLKILIDSMALCVSIMHVMKVCDRVFAY